MIIAFSNFSFRPFYFDIVYFEYKEDLVDSYDDRHKLILILYIFCDLFFTYFFVKILKYIFTLQANKREREYLKNISKNKAEEEKENKEKKEERKRVNHMFSSQS